MTTTNRIWKVFALLLCCAGFYTDTTYAQGKKPNILVIFGDDIGITNISCLQPRDDGLSNAQHRSDCQ